MSQAICFKSTFLSLDAVCCANAADAISSAAFSNEAGIWLEQTRTSALRASCGASLSSSTFIPVASISFATALKKVNGVVGRSKKRQSTNLVCVCQLSETPAVFKMSLLRLPFSCCSFGGRQDPFGIEMAPLESNLDEDYNEAFFESPESLTMARSAADVPPFDSNAILKPLAPDFYHIATNKCLS